MKKQNVIKRLVPFFKPYKGAFFLDLSSALVMALAGIIFPMLVRVLLNDVIASENIVWKALWTIAGLMVAVKAIESLCRYYMVTYGHIMGTKIERDIRMSLYEKYMRLPTSFYDNNKVGELMSRTTTDLFDITEFAHHCPEELFIMAVRLLGTFVYLMTISVKLTAIIFASIPLFIFVAFYFNKRMHSVFKKNRKKVAEINSHIEDTLSGIRVVKSYTNEKLETERFKKDNEDFVAIKRESYFNMGAFHTMLTIFTGVLYVLTAVVGALFIVKGEISSADLVVYLLYVSTLVSTIEILAQFTEQFQLGLSGFSRYCALMDTPESICDRPNATADFVFEDKIEFNKVTFGYQNEQNPVLTKLDVTVKKGENVAIIGPSGGGKTTMVNLLPRFYEISDGNIEIDGTDIRDFTLQALRENIGIVQQDVYLFNGTVAENIAYAKPFATKEEIMAAAQAAGADDFIEKMADKYDTLVGERGVRLSGGQKQRISIARLFLKNPPILILDEATSALDNESEKLVQQSLDRLSKGRTTFTIAHRLTTIKNAERILVLNENGIVEEGTHIELLAKNGIYAQLYKIYE